MRLGAYYAVLAPGSVVARAYEDTVVSERHRHRYEFNNAYRARFENAGFIPCGVSPDRRLVEFMELRDHPFYVGTQAHPEFKSRPDRAHPLFRELIAASLARAEGRNPQIPFEGEREVAEVGVSAGAGASAGGGVRAGARAN
jgi:CTP synthase